MQSNQPTKKKIPKAPQTNKQPKATKIPPKTLIEENSKVREKITGFSITLSIVYSLLIYITIDLY